MATTRVTHKRKVYSSGDRETWIEVERLDKLIVESGKGFSYQKTIYTFRWDNEQDDGTWDGSDERTEKKKIRNPDDDTKFVELPIIKYVDVETGKGFAYRKTRHHFDNTDENEVRKVHTKTVHGKDNPSDRLDVEVIDSITREFSRGYTYRKSVVTYNDQGDEQGDL